MRVPFNSFACNARMCATGSSLVPVTVEGMVLAEVVVAAACVVVIVVSLVAPL